MSVATCDYSNEYSAHSKLSLQVISAVDLPTNVHGGVKHVRHAFQQRMKDHGYAYFVTLNFYHYEVGRTELNDKGDGNAPTWQHMLDTDMVVFKSKEMELKRPYNLEYLDIDVFLQSGHITTKCAIGRISLSTISKGPQMIQLFHPHPDGHDRKHSVAGKLLLNLSLQNTLNSHEMAPPVFLTLREVLCSGVYPQYSHIFLDYECSSYGHVGSFVMPGPKVGEIVRDKHDSVLWRIDGPVNHFGDRDSIILKGSLIITDIRILYVPYELSGRSVSPIYGNPTTGLAADKSLIFREIGDIHMIRKLTLQIFFGSIVDTTYETIDPFQSLFYVEVMGWRRVFEFTISMERRKGEEAIEMADLDEMGGIDSVYEQPVDDVARAGLDTSRVRPSNWCLRATNFIKWKIKLGDIWLEWGKCMWETYQHYFLGDNCEQYRHNSWLSSPDQIMRNEYSRQNVDRSGWKITTENNMYGLCSNYPSVLAFPSGLSEGQKRLAADSRSMNRIPTLVWLHPQTRASLSRSAQPSLGMSRSAEYDKIFFLAIKQASPFGLPLRVCDARPFLNASANAMQGKGFENVDKLGGPSVCAITFLQIDNIHVMRESLKKLRAHFSSDSFLNEKAYESKWSLHVASILRGAVTVADSLNIGHPALVHCSDGWDRTPQLSSLAQLLLDPYFRTIRGFVVLVEKEWSSFGHKFDDRMNHCKSKESSPVFLQFLDCVYQVLIQFPVEFEFTDRLLVVIAQAAESGVLSTFMGNSEKERAHNIDDVLSRYPEAKQLHADFASLSVYIEMLCRSNFACYLHNASYCPPTAVEKKLKYIKPSARVGDIVVWKQGLLPYCQFFERVYCVFSQTGAEANALLLDNCKRVINYAERNAIFMPQVQRDTMDIACSELYSFWPSLVRRHSHFVACSSMAGQQLTRESYRFDSQVDIYEIECIASLRIVVWYKSMKLTTKLKARGAGGSWFWGGGSNEYEGVSCKVEMAVALVAWYIKNRGMRSLAVKSRLDLKIRELVVEIVEDAISPLDTFDVEVGEERKTEDSRVLRENLLIEVEEEEEEETSTMGRKIKMAMSNIWEKVFKGNKAESKGISTKSWNKWSVTTTIAKFDNELDADV